MMCDECGEIKSVHAFMAYTFDGMEFLYLCDECVEVLEYDGITLEDLEE